MNKLRVALTFDAEHPGRAHCSPGVQEGIVDILERERVRATFFMQGLWATAYPGTASRIADPRLGHLVGSHSEYHSPLTLLTGKGVRADLAAAEQSIRAVTGVDPRPWFRCPFGKGRDDPQLLSTLAECGYRNLNWDVDSGDYKNGVDARSVEDHVVKSVTAVGDGCVVLFHSWPDTTLAALPAIIARLRDAGAIFVTVADFSDATWWYLAHRFYRHGDFDEARRELLRELAESPALDRDTQAKARVKEMIALVALASDSPVDQTASLCAEAKRTGTQGGLRQRLETRALVADVWTALAVRLASGRRRNDEMAGSAAVRAILQNPLKSLSRPGLLRLAVRRVVLRFGRRPAVEPIPSRNPQRAASEVHNEDDVGLR